MNRKTEAEKTASRIVDAFSNFEDLSVPDRSKAFEMAGQLLDLMGCDVGVEYADACKALADAQWLQLFDPRLGMEKNG